MVCACCGEKAPNIVPLVGGSGRVEYVDTALDATCSSMAVSRLAAGGGGDIGGSRLDVWGLSGCELLLSPVKGGVGGTRDDLALGFEYTLPDIREEDVLRLPMRMYSMTLGMREVPRLFVRSSEVREPFPGDVKLADHNGEKAFGVSGNVCRSVRAVEGTDSPLELCIGVEIAPLSSDRRPRGSGGGGPAGRSRAIWTGKLSRRSGESTGVSDEPPNRADVGVGLGLAPFETKEG